MTELALDAGMFSFLRYSIRVIVITHTICAYRCICETHACARRGVLVRIRSRHSSNTSSCGDDNTAGSLLPHSTLTGRLSQGRESFRGPW